MISIREFTAKEHEEYVKPLIKAYFSQGFPHFDPDLIYDEKTKDIIADRRQLVEKFTPWTRIAAYKDDQIIGWSIGKPYAEDTFVMANSLVLPQYRRQGLYLRLLEETVKKAKALGFKKILSHHLAVNNGIIIAKLQAGFEISGVKVSDEIGILINLVLDLQK